MPRVPRFVDDEASASSSTPSSRSVPPASTSHGASATRRPNQSTMSAAAGSSAPKKKRFRLQGKKFLLTWPQCDVPASDVLTLIQEMFEDKLEYAVVAEEQHQDGTPHLHAFIKSTEKQQFNGVNCFDHLTGTHGNYQVAKSEVSSLRYVCKDGKYVAHGVDPKVFLQAAKEKSSTKIALVVQDIQAGKTLQELNDSYPTVMFMHKRKVDEYINFLNVLRSQKTLLAWPSTVVPADAEPHDLTISTWLDTNIKKARFLGTKQLWLQGPTECGKTTFIMNLSKYLRIYVVPMDEDFYDMYDDTLYDLIVFEEYKSQKTVQWMNKFVDGQPVALRKKGSQVMKIKNLPVIVCSNYTMQDCYRKLYDSKPEVFATLERRFTMVQVPSGSKINVLYTPQEQVDK